MKAVLKDSIGRKRFEVSATDYVTNTNGELLLLALEGPEQATRACWANVVKKRRGTRLTDTELTLKTQTKEMVVSVFPNSRYHSCREGDVLIVLNHRLDKLNSRFVIGGDEETPSPWFPRALEKLDRLPYMAAWIPTLWRAAIQDDLIVPMSTDYASIRVWRVGNNQARWQSIVRHLLRDGRLEVTGG